MVETLERDSERTQSAFDRVNRSPLGACAITSTGFSIDRGLTADLLGFDAVQVNSYGAIAAVDHLLESASALVVAAIGIGRFTQDLLLWSTAEFGFMRLSPAFLQISSIMPQKRNPVALEHVRVLASRALTQAGVVPGVLHNTPFGDINDAEDPLQPLLWAAFDDGQQALRLLAGILAEASFDTELMEARAGKRLLTVTELADTLVREAGIPFAEAHRIITGVVDERGGDDDLDRLAVAVERRLAQLDLHLPPESVRLALDPREFVERRTATGGPAAAALVPELERAAGALEADRNWLDTQRRGIVDASTRRQAAAEELRNQTPDSSRGSVLAE